MRAYIILIATSAVIALFQAGCASYTVPGPGARMETFGVVTPGEREMLTDQQIQRELELKPLASFPANICVAHVQGTDYRNAYGRAYGRGAYSIVTTREVETDEHFKRLADMPMVQGVATVSRMLLPSQLNSDMELRRAAAKLHTQVLLVYTYDTDFYDENSASPLDVVTLGFGSHKKVRITTTATAALLDVRNGYVYGVAESTAQREQDTSSWNNEAKADEARRQAEAEAFEGLVDEISKTWASAVRQYMGVYETAAIPQHVE